MKIGFSFGRCLRDIVNGVVDYNDVLIIYAATHVATDQHIEKMVEAYMHRRAYLDGLNQEECVKMAKRLYHSGKVHQPRAFGVSPMNIGEAGGWMDLAPTVTNQAQQSELVQKTWRDYQMALKLTSPESVPDDQFRKRTPQEQKELDEALDLLAGSI